MGVLVVFHGYLLLVFLHSYSMLVVLRSFHLAFGPFGGSEVERAWGGGQRYLPYLG